MKKNYLYLLLITCIALFASCRDDKEYTYEPAKNIIFNGSLPQDTRVNATTWDKDDQVGVYMIGSLASFDVLDGADNKKFHTPNGDGVFWHYDNLNTIRFPEGRGQVDFVSYHPYQSDIKNFEYSIDVANQSNQSAIDLLYSKNATGVAKDVVPSLIFDHKLTKLVFNITGTGGLSDLEGLKVTLSALPTTGTFNLSDGVLTTLEGTSNVVMKTTIDSKDLLKATGEGIVIPTAAAKRVLTFTLNVDGASKSFDVDASTYVFEAGKKNKYDVTLDAKLGAIIKPTSTITPWEDGSSEVIDVDVSDGEKEDNETVIFHETFGTPVNNSGWPLVANYTDYTAKNMTYSDPYGTASSIRLLKNSTNEANVWLPANKESGLKIEGIPTNQTGLVLTYDILSNSKTDIKTADIIQVKANNVALTVPAKDLSYDMNSWTTVTLNLPDNTTNIEFYSATALNTVGIRIANIKLVAKGGDAPEEPKTKGIIFTETFGAGAKNAANKWIKIDAYADYSAKNVIYSDPYTGKWADIRNLKEISNVWFPAFATDKESGFKIDGIVSGYSEMQLEYDMLAQNPTTSDIIQVKCNGTIINITPIEVNNSTWSTVTVDIPDNTTSIEFYSGSTNTVGIRVANIKLQGAK